jgi:agmatinase
MDLDGGRRVTAAGCKSCRLIGLPTDSHSSFLRGAASAPAAIRLALASAHSNMAAESGADMTIDDAGDLPLDESDGDVARIRSAAASAARDGVVPLFLGGDHMVTYPVVAGLAEAVGPLSILHFDAHPDLYDDFEGDPLSHASPFARIMEQGLARRLVQVGIRTSNHHCREQARRFGVETVEMREFAADRVPMPDSPLYVSIDLDALDPAFAPGVSHREPGGMTTRQAIDLIQRLQGQVVGADIVEFNPRMDPLHVTGTVCAKLFKEIAAKMLE